MFSQRSSLQVSQSFQEHAPEEEHAEPRPAPLPQPELPIVDDPQANFPSAKATNLKVFDRGHLSRPAGPEGCPHEIYYEQCGNPDGPAVLALHGGPGYVLAREDLGFIDGDKQRLILFHQRGVGLSKPAGETRDNNTPELLKDIEALREHLGVDTWHVFGWSWGSTLALSYCSEYSAAVSALTTFGNYLCSAEEDRYYLERLGELAPEIRAAYEEISPSDISRTYGDGFFAAIGTEREDKAIRLWYELRDDAPITDSLRARFAVRLHYQVHDYFLSAENIIKKLAEIEGIDVSLVQGRNDPVCPVSTTQKLGETIEGAKTRMLEASHSISEEIVQQELKRRFDSLL